MASYCRCLVYPHRRILSSTGRDYGKRSMSILAIWDASSFADIPKRIRFWYSAKDGDVEELVFRRRIAGLREDQTFREKRYQSLGPDLAAATFIVHREGKVKFAHLPKWTTKSSSRVEAIPNKKVNNFHLEGIDASGMTLLPIAFDNLKHLQHLKYLNLSAVELLDDWHLEKLSRFSGTLEFLDISNNPRVTNEGLASLHKLRNLKCVNIQSCSGIQHGDVVLTYLSELNPDLTVIGQDSLPKEESSLAELENKQLRFLNIGDRLDNITTRDSNDSDGTNHKNQSAEDTESANVTREDRVKVGVK